jgi:hypothetical protein
VPSKLRATDASWGLLALATTVALGAYVGVRAWTLSFTHDESLSYTSYVHDPFSSIALGEGTDANNHPLNTLAMKLAADLIGTSELALRWASVAAFVAYVVAVVALLRQVRLVAVRALGLALAVVNPYVLDFFSLARGYGLALALVTASAVATLTFVATPRAATAFAATASAGLAVMANYAALTCFVAVLVVIGFACLVPDRAGKGTIAPRRLGAVLALPTAGVVILGIIPAARLRSKGELYFGGDDGFWEDTVDSLVTSTLYGRDWELLDVMLVALLAMAVVGGAVASAVAIRRRKLPLHAASYVLLAVPAIVSIVQHYVLDTPFLIGRTALFFVPLFAIWLSLAADALGRRGRLTRGITATAVVVVAACCINLATAANLSYTLDWRFDATTEDAINEVVEASGGAQTIDLRVSFLFQPTTNFYRETRFKQLPECFSDCLDTRSEYSYVIGPDIATVRARGARVIRIYEVSAGVLARDPAP